MTTIELILSLAFMAVPAAGQSLTWLSNHDGDTITYLKNGEHVQGRIRFIDTPEIAAFPIYPATKEILSDKTIHWSDQPFSRQARDKLTELMMSYRPRIIERGHDVYGRTLVDLGNLTVQRELVRQGLAWARGSQCKKEQAIARKERRGIWGEACPVDPADWRKGIVECWNEKR